MVNYRYLGYGITNEQGIATLDHDAQGNPITHSYTGTGAGKVDIVASLDDSSHISESSIQSETYELMDAMYYDPALSGNHNDSIWYKPTATLTRGDDGSVVHPTSAWGGIQLGSTSQAIFIPVETVIEFDLIDFSPSFIIQMRSGVQQSGNWVYCEPVKYTGHQRWEIHSNTQKIMVDGVVKQNMTQNLGESYRFSFLSQNTTDTCKFANLKIYPL